jgi:hypothetical protein
LSWFNRKWIAKKEKEGSKRFLNPKSNHRLNHGELTNNISICHLWLDGLGAASTTRGEQPLLMESLLSLHNPALDESFARVLLATHSQKKLLSGVFLSAHLPKLTHLGQFHALAPHFTLMMLA